MDKWLGTAVAVFGIVTYIFIEYTLLKFRPHTEGEDKSKKFSKYDIIIGLQAISLLFFVMLLIHIWSGAFPWLRPQIIASVSIPW